MNYEMWAKTVPAEITGDSLWKMEAYRLALFAADSMLPKAITILLAEFRESFRMALSAVAAHKLRSALTLLGVLVGVFSIIVVMTAMRVMQSTIEARTQPAGRPDLHGPEISHAPVYRAGRHGEDPAAEEHHPPGRPAIAWRASRWRARLASRPTSGRVRSRPATGGPRRMCASTARPRAASPPATGSCRRPRACRRRRGRRARRVRARQQPGPDHLSRGLSGRRAGED